MAKDKNTRNAAAALGLLAPSPKQGKGAPKNSRNKEAIATDSPIKSATAQSGPVDGEIQEGAESGQPVAAAPEKLAETQLNTEEAVQTQNRRIKEKREVEPKQVKPGAEPEKRERNEFLKRVEQHHQEVAAEKREAAAEADNRSVEAAAPSVSDKNSATVEQTHDKGQDAEGHKAADVVGSTGPAAMATERVLENGVVESASSTTAGGAGDSRGGSEMAASRESAAEGASQVAAAEASRGTAALGDALRESSANEQSASKDAPTTASALENSTVSKPETTVSLDNAPSESTRHHSQSGEALQTAQQTTEVAQAAAVKEAVAKEAPVEVPKSSNENHQSATVAAEPVHQAVASRVPQEHTAGLEPVVEAVASLSKEKSNSPLNSATEHSAQAETVESSHTAHKARRLDTFSEPVAEPVAVAQIQQPHRHKPLLADTETTSAAPVPEVSPQVQDRHKMREASEDSMAQSPAPSQPAKGKARVLDTAESTGPAVAPEAPAVQQQVKGPEHNSPSAEATRGLITPEMVLAASPGVRRPSLANEGPAQNAAQFDLKPSAVPAGYGFKESSPIPGALVEHLTTHGMPPAEANATVSAISPGLHHALENNPQGAGSQLMFHSKGEVAVSIESSQGAALYKQGATAVDMGTLRDIHREGMPNGGIQEIRNNLGQEVRGLSKLDVVQTFGHDVVSAVQREGFPQEPVQEVKAVLQGRAQQAGIGADSVTNTKALQALGEAAREDGKSITLEDKNNPSRTTEVSAQTIRKELGWTNDRQDEPSNDYQNERARR